MTRNIPEGFQTGSGLREDYIFDVHHSYFGTDANYQDGEALLLIWEGDDEDGEPAREIFSMGKDWVSNDLGKTAVGKAKKINRNSMYGRVLDWLVEDEQKALLDIVAARGIATQSDIWNGLRFHMKEKEFTFKRKGEEPTINAKVMPAEFLGVVGEEAPKAGSSSTSTTASTGPTSTTLGSVVTNKLLSRLAATHTSFDDFVSEALDIPEVMEDNALRAHVSDESDAGYFQQNRGS